MKKVLTALTFAACIMALTACGGSKGENVETEAPAASASSGEASGTDTVETDASGNVVSLPEDYEPETIEGELIEMDGSTVTVETDDGTKLVFDIAGAETFDDEYLLTGSYVEVSYAIVDGDVYPAEYITVLMDIEEYAAFEDRDPIIKGTVQLMDINDLIIIDEMGEERELNNQMSRTVSFGDINPGDKVTVTYAGNLLEDDDEVSLGFKVVAIKIVADDALGSEEAEENYVIGAIDTIYTGSGVFQLITEPDTFEVVIDEDLLEGFDENDRVKVYYEGTIGGRNITASSIEKIEE